MDKGQRRPHCWREDIEKERLIFAKAYLDKPQSLWENALWIDKTKTELFGNAYQQFVYKRRNEAYTEKNSLPTVKHGGRSIMSWGCVAASGTGGLDRTTGIMKSEDHQEILERNVLISVRKPGLSRRSSPARQRPKAHRNCWKRKNWVF